MCSLPFPSLTGIRDLLLRAYAGISGYSVTDTEIQRIKSKDCEPTYGELCFDGARHMMELLQIRPSDNFYDIGCGVGKLVLQTALTTGATCTGVELCKSRFDKAARALNYVRSKTYIPNVRLIKSDATQLNYSVATVVYMCSTCFETSMMEKIIRSLSPGCRVVLQTPPAGLKGYPRIEQLELIQTIPVPVTWTGSVNLYVYRVTVPCVLCEDAHSVDRPLMSDDEAVHSDPCSPVSPSASEFDGISDVSDTESNYGDRN